VRDLGGRNTTLVNGYSVTECAVAPGDEIAVGHLSFLVTATGMDVPMPSSDLLGQATVALVEADAIYLAEGGTIEADARFHHTVPDLARLFRYSRSLSLVRTVPELLDVIKHEIISRFEPAVYWLALVEDKDDGEGFRLSRSDRSCTVAPMPESAMEQALTELRGLLVPKRRRGCLELTLAAPIHFGDHRIGVVSLQNTTARRAYDESDLHFLVSLAHATAPVFGAIEQREELERQVERLGAAQQEESRLIGESNVMDGLRRLIRRVANSRQTAFVTGETGTGKELVARQIHLQSPRHLFPLVTVNCAAIPRELFESELFGHAKGAYTDAKEDIPGLLAQAHGGTLFLDEVGDLSLDNQARILRVIENQAFRPVGARKEVQVDVRFVGATNKDLPVAVQAGMFRNDLFHRLNGFAIHVPPLRDRKEDIPLLARHFLERHKSEANRPITGITSEAIDYLTSRFWPGNVRELRHCIQRAVALAKRAEIQRDDIFAEDAPDHAMDSPDAGFVSLAEIERRHIATVLRQCGFNIRQSAAILQVSRNTLYSKIAQYQIKP
jgi:DNA-binding NtrC family response regulator